jgi:hypothetical protein
LAAPDRLGHVPNGNCQEYELHEESFEPDRCLDAKDYDCLMVDDDEGDQIKQMYDGKVVEDAIPDAFAGFWRPNRLY